VCVDRVVDCKRERRSRRQNRLLPLLSSLPSLNGELSINQVFGCSGVCSGVVVVERRAANILLACPSCHITSRCIGLLNSCGKVQRHANHFRSAHLAAAAAAAAVDCHDHHCTILTHLHPHPTPPFFAPGSCLFNVLSLCSVSSGVMASIRRPHSRTAATWAPTPADAKLAVGTFHAWRVRCSLGCSATPSQPPLLSHKSSLMQQRRFAS
jgi:hypothetical protein